MRLGFGLKWEQAFKPAHIQNTRVLYLLKIRKNNEREPYDGWPVAVLLGRAQKAPAIHSFPIVPKKRENRG